MDIWCGRSLRPINPTSVAFFILMWLFHALPENVSTCKLIFFLKKYRNIHTIWDTFILHFKVFVSSWTWVWKNIRTCHHSTLGSVIASEIKRNKEIVNLYERKLSWTPTLTSFKFLLCGTKKIFCWLRTSGLLMEYIQCALNIKT